MTEASLNLFAVVDGEVVVTDAPPPILALLKVPEKPVDPLPPTMAEIMASVV